jgi:hypothetical protein
MLYINSISKNKGAGQMTYQQLQAELKELRNQGKTTIKLNQKKVILQAEYDRIKNEEEIEKENEKQIEGLFIPTGQWTLSEYSHLYGTPQYDLLQKIAVFEAIEEDKLYRSFYARAVELGICDRDPGFDGGVIENG